LLPVAEKCNLAVAIKIGAVRGMQPGLRGGGDGVTTADMADLQRLLVRYPQVRSILSLLLLLLLLLPPNVVMLVLYH